MFVAFFGVLAFVGAALDAEIVRAAAVKALDLSGWSCEEAVAEQIGISVSRLSKQLNGHDPLTFLARAYLLDGFWLEFLFALSEPCGVFLVRHTDLQQLILGLYELEKKVMAKADLPSLRERKRA